MTIWESTIKDHSNSCIYIYVRLAVVASMVKFSLRCTHLGCAAYIQPLTSPTVGNVQSTSCWNPNLIWWALAHVHVTPDLCNSFCRWIQKSRCSHVSHPGGQALDHIGLYLPQKITLTWVFLVIKVEHWDDELCSIWLQSTLNRNILSFTGLISVCLKSLSK